MLTHWPPTATSTHCATGAKCRTSSLRRAAFDRQLWPQRPFPVHLSYYLRRARISRVDSQRPHSASVAVLSGGMKGAENQRFVTDAQNEPRAPFTPPDGLNRRGGRRLDASTSIHQPVPFTRDASSRLCTFTLLLTQRGVAGRPAALACSILAPVASHEPVCARAPSPPSAFVTAALETFRTNESCVCPLLLKIQKGRARNRATLPSPIEDNVNERRLEQN